MTHENGKASCLMGRIGVSQGTTYSEHFFAERTITLSVFDGSADASKVSGFAVSVKETLVYFVHGLAVPCANMLAE